MPLALCNPPCFFREAAIAALNQAGIPWHIAFTSLSVHGIWAAVDAGLGTIFQTLKPRGGAWIITADHGNAETMIDPVTGGPHTYHTTNPVPLILVSSEKELRLRPNGSLRDIAPTMLSALGQLPPAEMTGEDLCVRP